MLRKAIEYIKGLGEQISLSEESRLKDLMDRIDKGDVSEIKIDEINLILKHKYKQPRIEGKYFKIRKEYINSLLFTPMGFTASRDESGGIIIEAVLKEISIDSGIKLTIPISEYAEFLERVKITMYDGVKK